jgi:hypothetical protein
MQKWEYLITEADYFRVCRVDGQDLPFRKDAEGKSARPSWVDYAKELGEQGWELAGISTGSTQDRFTAFFKRPKP